MVQIDCHYQHQASCETSNFKEEINSIKSLFEGMKSEIENLKKENVKLSGKIVRLQSRVANLEMNESHSRQNNVTFEAIEKSNSEQDGNISTELFNVINESKKKRDQWEREKESNLLDSDLDSMEDFGD